MACAGPAGLGIAVNWIDDLYVRPRGQPRQGPHRALESPRAEVFAPVAGCQNDMLARFSHVHSGVGNAPESRASRT